ncbi:MBG domain-containing protein, partial [Polynucleobacter sp. Fuers-14]|uniref:MBG domain-containing protein n=1 Tax=Polynucleobacter sp. Fuers-14 TaxID=1758364 RepID=UPI00272AB834
AVAYGGTSQNAINAATYTIVPSGLTSANYTITYANGSLTVNKAGLTVTADNKSKEYGAANPSLTYTITGYVNNETAAVLTGAPTIATTATTTTGAGTVAITAAANNLAATNYSFTYANGTLTINPKALTITAADQSTTYGTALVLGTNNTGATRYTATGLVNSDTVTAVALAQNSNTTVPATQGAGTYSGSTNGILVSGATGTGLANYTITYVPSTLTINQKALTVTAANATKTYDGQAYTGGNGVTYSGFVNSETASALGGAVA